MLNKELLMVGGKYLEPVLSIYISPDLSYLPTVSGTLSSKKAFYVDNFGEKTFKFSEIDPTAVISIIYYEGTQITTSNLVSASAPYSVGDARHADHLTKHLCIRDRTQSASLSIDLL